MQNENRLVPDFRPETTETYTEKFTSTGGTEQTATYKIGGAHPIIGGILDKFTWIRTHVAAVWWNALEGITLKSKIDTMDAEIAQLNGKMPIGYKASSKINLSEYINSQQYTFPANGIVSISTSYGDDKWAACSVYTKGGTYIAGITAIPSSISGAANCLLVFSGMKAGISSRGTGAECYFIPFAYS